MVIKLEAILPAIGTNADAWSVVLQLGGHVRGDDATDHTDHTNQRWMTSAPRGARSCPYLLLLPSTPDQYL